MPTFSTRDAAKQLGVTATTLSRYIAAKKVPAPKTVSTGGITVHLWTKRDIEQVRQLPPATDLRRLLFHRVDRLVRRDSTFLLKNRFFEAPSHLAGKRIEVRFDPLDLTQLEIYSEGKPEGRARLVDAVVNGLLPPWETEEK